MYNLIGFDGKGIGSKLLGKLSAYAVAKGFREVSLAAGHGYALKDGKKVKKYAFGFYDKTNFKPRMEGWFLNYFWGVVRKIGVRKPKQRPPTMGPQNLLRQDAMLNRRVSRRK